MSTNRTSARGWRKIAAAMLASGLALTAVACGSDTGEAGNSDNSITIKHQKGETTIEGTPTRIVAIGNQWIDATLSLGVTPVGYVDNIAVVGGGKSAPWEPAALQDGESLKPTAELVEQIAALNPDLILASGFAVDQAKYDQLSKLAPTISDIGSAQVDPWGDQVSTLGRVLNKEAEADKVIADVNGQIDAVAKKYPGLQGKTFLTCFLAGATQLMVLADPKDGSSEMFIKLGMSVPPKLAEESSKGGRLALSPERFGDLTSDLLVATGQEEPYKKLPAYATLPSVEKGSIIFLDIVDISGLNQPTPLSLPYLLKKLEPALANAAK